MKPQRNLLSTLFFILFDNKQLKNNKKQPQNNNKQPVAVE